jgi:hypothetical protein
MIFAYWIKIDQHVIKINWLDVVNTCVSFINEGLNMIFSPLKYTCIICMILTMKNEKNGVLIFCILIHQDSLCICVWDVNAIGWFVISSTPIPKGYNVGNVNAMNFAF